MIWLLGIYMWMCIHRPFEIWPVLGSFQMEWFSALGLIAVWLVWPGKVWTINRLHIAMPILWGAILLAWANSPYMNENSFVMEAYFKVVVFFILFVTSVKDEKDLKTLVMAYLIAFIIYVTHSFWEYFNGRATFRMGISRMGGVDVTYGDPNQFAASIIYSLPMTLIVWWNKPATWQKVVLVCYTGLVGFCVLKTGSRAGFVGLSACGFLIAMHSKYRKTILAGGMVLGALGIAFLSDSQQNRLLSLIDSSYGPANANVSARGRIDGFMFGIQAWQQSPLFGWGPNAFGEVTKRHGGAHNLYGQMLAEVGLVGALAFVGVIVCVALNEWESYRAHRGRPRGVAWWTCRAITINFVLLLFIGWSGHSLFRYYWVWYAAFQVAALHCTRTLPTLSAPVTARLPWLVAPRRLPHRAADPVSLRLPAAEPRPAAGGPRIS
jgi:O-antigen ligase